MKRKSRKALVGYMYVTKTGDAYETAFTRATTRESGSGEAWDAKVEPEVGLELEDADELAEDEVDVEAATVSLAAGVDSADCGATVEATTISRASTAIAIEAWRENRGVDMVFGPGCAARRLKKPGRID